MKNMPTFSILVYWTIFALGFPTTYTVDFRGHTFLANKADSLRQVCRDEMATLDSVRAFVREENRKLDSLFAPFPDHSWYRAKKREGAEFIRRADSLEGVVRRDLDGLD